MYAELGDMGANIIKIEHPSREMTLDIGARHLLIQKQPIFWELIGIKVLHWISKPRWLKNFKEFKKSDVVIAT